MTSQRERIKVGTAALWNLPTECEGRHRRQLVEKSIRVLGDCGGLTHIDRRWFRLAGDGGEVLFDQRSSDCVIKIPGDRKHGVVRRVIDAKELADVFDSCGVEIFHR